MEDYRLVPVPVLREFALTRCQTTSIRKIAEDVGIGRSTLHKFIQGQTSPHPRIRRLLAIWFLKKRHQGDEFELDVDIARPYAAAIDVLLAEMPAEQRERAKELVVAALDVGFALGPVTRPRWLTLLSAPSEARSLRTT